MAHKHKDILVALAGQPNCGKSSVFQHLTGIHQQVANYPGITVDKRQGHYKHRHESHPSRLDSTHSAPSHHDGGNDHAGHYHQESQRIEVVDLPGTYSLTSYTQEERVARDFLLLQNPEVLVVIVDASNLKRHFYLMFQLLELQLPTIICLNMMDVAQRRGIRVDAEKLAEILGVPVVVTHGTTGEGMDRLRRKILETVQNYSHEFTSWKLHYGENLEKASAEVETLLLEHPHLLEDFSARWLAVKFLEKDRDVRRILQHHTHDDKWETLLAKCYEIFDGYEKTYGETPQKTIVVQRNLYASRIEEEVVQRDPARKFHKSDRFDAYVCHPVLGLVFLVLCMVFTFGFTFLITGNIPWVTDFCGNWYSPVDAVDTFFSSYLPSVLTPLFHLQTGTPIQSLLMDGVVAGVGGILTFVPIIFVMFLILSLLEQCGYIARVALIMDRFMRIFGLQGQSILPLVLAGGIAGGCAVPAVMATRGMKDKKERLLTILVLPMMNCGAKQTVYALLVITFFSGLWQSLVFTSLLLVSWGGALISAKILSKTLVPGSSSPLLLELPAYQFPRWQDILRTAGFQCWWFIRKAGTIILAVNVFLWCFMYYPNPESGSGTEADRVTDSVNNSSVNNDGVIMDSADNEESGQESRLANSYAGQFGRFLEPVTHYAGFDWRDNVALVGGFVAKEVIVSSLGTLYNMDSSDEELETKLSEQLAASPDWNPVRAYAMMIFVMFYAPCTASASMILRETGSWYWMFVAMAFSTLVAYAAAVFVFQIGSLLFLTG
ncbi:MAG: ferrous iron transport protein B [Planctomycetaceae bacterium]|jgi:ferrous iron transport protein B|nr:ferrous iron transport protein B [Planctomycetaceae bacterium]